MNSFDDAIEAVIRSLLLLHINIFIINLCNVTMTDFVAVVGALSAIIGIVICYLLFA
jgi:hypothetical protein